jgi:hypothetical protein
MRHQGFSHIAGFWPLEGPDFPRPGVGLQSASKPEVPKSTNQQIALQGEEDNNDR